MNNALGQARPPRMVIYSQDGLGLGHMRRTNSIASRFLQQCPEAGILTLSDSQLGQFFEKAANHDYLKLPSIVKQGPGDWRAVNLPMPFGDVLSMRQDLIRSAVLSFAPDILLVDHMPHGAMGELLPTLEALRARRGQTRVVLGLRDILDAPEVVTQRWQSEGAFDALERFYDRVLVYGMREVYDVAEQYRFPVSIRNRLTYCGYVSSALPKGDASRLRTRLLGASHADAELVVAMAGGGADAYPMMRSMIDAYPAAQAQGRFVFVLVTGPFMPAEMRNKLRASARHLPVRVVESVNNPVDYMLAADHIFAMAGYNTTMELLRLHRRAVLIPRAGPSAEQRTRARLFADRNWVETLDPDQLSGDAIAQMIIPHSNGNRTATSPAPLDLNGLDHVVDQLRAMVARATPPEPSDAPIARDSRIGPAAPLQAAL